MPRRMPPVVAAAALAAVVAIVVGCGESLGSPSPSPLASASASASQDVAATPTGSSSSAPGATGPSASDAAPSPAIGQTDTEFGRIWDQLPSGFPAYPGSNPTETGEGPVSGQFSVPADVATVAAFLQAGMEGAGYSTDALSGPFEDGSMTLESSNPDFGECRVRTTIAPAGDTTLVTVLYGADCPNG